MVYIRGCQCRCSGMIWVGFVNHLSYIIDCIPEFEIGITCFSFIAYRPYQKRRMVFEAFDCCFYFIKLSFYRRTVVIIKAVGLSSDIEPEIYIKSFFLCAVQNSHALVRHPICSDNIGSEVFGFSIEVVACGSFDI